MSLDASCSASKAVIAAEETCNSGFGRRGASLDGGWCAPIGAVGVASTGCGGFGVCFAGSPGTSIGSASGDRGAARTFAGCLGANGGTTEGAGFGGLLPAWIADGLDCGALCCAGGSNCGTIGGGSSAAGGA
jgi:hypothetical protein